MSANFAQPRGVADLGAKGDIDTVGESEIGIAQVAKLQRHDGQTGKISMSGSIPKVVKTVCRDVYIP